MATDLPEWEPSQHYGITRQRAIELGEDAEYPRGSAAILHFDKLTPKEQQTVIQFKERELLEVEDERRKLYKDAIKSAGVARRLGVDPQALNPFPAKKKSAKEAIRSLTEQVANLKERASKSVGMPTTFPKVSDVKKEPWQMTREQYAVEEVQAREARRSPFKIDYTGKDKPEAYLPWFRRRHQDFVEQAISEGKPVPPEVLAEYPDLRGLSEKPSRKKKAEVATETSLQSIHDSRSPRSRESDERQSNADTIEPDDHRVEQWKRSPGSMDVSGIDTPRKHKGKKVARKTKKSTRTETQVRGIRK